MSELERINDFLRTVDETASTSVEAFQHGIAFFHERLPRVYDRNFLLFTWEAAREAAQEIDADSVVAAAEELQGGAGLTHRKVVFEDGAAGERVAAALGRAGWEPRGLAVMVYRGKPDAAAAAEASEVDRRALLPALEALVRSEPWGQDDEVVRQLSEADAAIGDPVRQRCFARLLEGRVVSSCRLFSDGSTAQIEDVATIPGHRRRGYAEAVVSRAAAEAAAAHDLVFLTAVDGRWVKRWYERLGFQQVGLRYDATRSA
jgi:GNAT superfamily N-acetyltransferase